MNEENIPCVVEFTMSLPMEKYDAVEARAYKQNMATSEYLTKALSIGLAALKVIETKVNYKKL